MISIFSDWKYQKRSGEGPTREELNEEAMSVPSTETRPLWTIAAKEWTGAEWEIVLRYTHAECAAEAETNYRAARFRENVPFEIISVGLTIGFHIEDAQGAVLSA